MKHILSSFTFKLTPAQANKVRKEWKKHKTLFGTNGIIMQPIVNKNVSLGPQRDALRCPFG